MGAYGLNVSFSSAKCVLMIYDCERFFIFISFDLIENCQICQASYETTIVLCFVMDGCVWVVMLVSVDCWSFSIVSCLFKGKKIAFIIISRYV